MPELLKGPVMLIGIGAHRVSDIYICASESCYCLPPDTSNPTIHLGKTAFHVKDMSLLLDPPGLHPSYMQRVLDSCGTNREEIAGKVAKDFYVPLLKAIFLKAQGWTVEPALPSKQIK